MSDNLAKAFSIRDEITKKQYLFPLMAFIIPLLVRAIPEVLAGQYILGFDTMGFYVPDIILWQHSGVTVWNYLAGAPLFYTILTSIMSTGVPILVALKVTPTFLLGFLGLSIYYYARKGLGWSNVKSLMPALLGTLYFVALRVSWDMLRTELGLIFFFVVLTLLSITENNSWKRYLLLSLAMMAVVLSHQLVSVLMLGTILFTLAYRIIRKEPAYLIKLVVAILPSFFFFLIINVAAVIPSGLQDYSASNQSPLASWLGFSSYGSMVISEAGFFVYCFLPLLPLVLISLKRLDSFQLKSWLLLSLILVLIPFAFVSPYRWLILLVYPFAFYATEALSLLKNIKLRKYRLPLFRVATIYLVISTAVFSVGYVTETTASPFFYFDPTKANNYIYQIPSSLLQNTVSIYDCKDVENILFWFNTNTNSSALLLTHTVFYSWAILSVNNSQVVDCHFDNPTKTAQVVYNGSISEIYFIWWTPGEGWYDQPTLPSSFSEVYHSGDLALYIYTQS